MHQPGGIENSTEYCVAKMSAKIASRAKIAPVPFHTRIRTHQGASHSHGIRTTRRSNGKQHTPNKYSAVTDTRGSSKVSTPRPPQRTPPRIRIRAMMGKTSHFMVENDSWSRMRAAFTDVRRLRRHPADREVRGLRWNRGQVSKSCRRAHGGWGWPHWPEAT